MPCILQLDSMMSPSKFLLSSPAPGKLKFSSDCVKTILPMRRLFFDKDL